MSKLSVLFVFSTFLFSLSSCFQLHDTTPIVLDPEKPAHAAHLGYGVWVNHPQGFEKAKTFNGYQSYDATASISVRLSSVPISSILENFSATNLSRNKQELLQLSRVNYGGNENAFYAKIRDKRKKTIRYLLAINDGINTYNIKAFYFESEAYFYESKIQGILLSAFIGEEEKLESTFKLAKMVSIKEVVFTKDALFPTKSEDESMIRVTEFGPKESNNPTKYVENVFYDLIQLKAKMVKTEKLQNGKRISVKGSNDSTKAYVTLILDNKSSGTLISATGNLKSKIKEFEQFVEKEFMSTTIGY